MEYVIVKVPGLDGRHELREQGSGRIVAAGSAQAILAASKLFGPARIEDSYRFSETRDGTG